MTPVSRLPKLTVKRGILLAVLLAATWVLLTLFSAPQGRPESSGSTYVRSPDGYAAWYAYMAEQGTPIQRWQKPFDALASGGITLVRVQSLLAQPGLNAEEEDWVAEGNRLILLGVRSPVSEANFTSYLPSPAGVVQVDTRRRRPDVSPPDVLLGDPYGAIAWQRGVDNGEAILIGTPYLGANAYQNEPGNFEFLAQLVTETDGTVLIDEYIHGYRDAEVIAEEVAESLTSYLAKTPLVPVLTQLVMVGLVLVWAKTRRFGAVMPLAMPEQNNSKAYIEALAGVLRKAETSTFVVSTLGREEQQHIQRELGLGIDPVEPSHLLATWIQQTGRPTRELEQALRPYWQQQLNEAALTDWLKQVQAIHQVLEQLRAQGRSEEHRDRDSEGG